jgi:hypothetical protein
MNVLFWLWSFLRFSVVDDEGGGPASVDRGDDVDTSGDDASADAGGEDEGEDKGDDDAGTDGVGSDEGEGNKKTEKKDPGLIPRARLNEEIRKRKEDREAAAARVAELEAQLKSVSGKQDASKLEAEVDELEEELEAARADGNKDRMKQLRETIRQKNKQIVMSEVQGVSKADADQAREEMRAEILIETYETQYPVLNPSSEEFDEDLVQMVNELRLGKIAAGMPLSTALKSSVETIMRRFKVVAVDKAPETKEEKKEDKAEKVRAERKAAAVDKATKATKAQPASLRSAGDNADTGGVVGGLPDIANMSADEFAALPVATQRRLRGDDV